MRKIQTDAEAQRKWIALAMSTTAAMILWFVGAAVFMVAERKQNWSYFVSLYFSYTSLLTIGYGDLQPTAESGKPFFVFWSLLAVPTLTVLISNMGDTVVKAISDLVNWTGTLTILPGENGMKAAWRSAAQAAGKRFPGNFETTFPGKATPSKHGDESQKNRESAVHQHVVDRLGKYIEDEQLQEAREAGEHGDTVQRDRHLYLYVLSKELRQLMKDVQESPPKEYSYQEWAWYLKLVGQDEADKSNHRDPPIEPDQKREDAKDEREYLGQGGGTRGHLAWSWLGTRSPLLGNKSEAEWILEALSTALEHELYDMHSGKKNRRRPPISFDDVVKKQKEEERSDGAKYDKNTEVGAEDGTRDARLSDSASVSSDSSSEDTYHDTQVEERDERSMAWE